MNDEFLKSLKNIEAPEPSGAARTRALDAAMAAFDAAQAEESEKNQKKNSESAQGGGTAARLRSITSRWKRNWTMDIRVPLGATVAALLVVPMGWYFLNQTALTPVELSMPSLPPITSADGAGEMEVANVQTRQAQEFPTAPAAIPAPVAESLGNVAMEQTAASPTFSSAPMPAGGFARTGLYETKAGDGDRFTAFDEGGVKLTANEPVSTFSIDVDTTSYAYMRRVLEMGQIPPADAIRVEELINYFSYDYPAPEAGGAPFLPTIAVHPSPWNAESRLVHIGIRAQDVDISEVPPANLVFLIDTSGSMDEPDRLPLLKRAFALLVNELSADDTVSIVTYAGAAGVVLEPTSGAEKRKILAALENLQPGGSTAGAQGIEAAYRLAQDAMIEGGTNRVLLATDGDFNVGISDPDGLERLIEGERRKGIFLSVLGFGMGNYNDATMQSLAQAGNGTAAYIDSFSEARKVLVEELGGTLLMVAKDVKVQVEFNPAAVSEYRLIGYETRALNREDFNNDAVDAGDVGAGHSVTAIYEIVPAGARGSVDPLRYGENAAAPALGEDDEFGFLKIRYKAPDSEVSQLIEAPIPVAGQYRAIADAPQDMRFATAVAAFGQKLRGSGHLAAMSWDDIRALALFARGEDASGRRSEFLRLVDIAASLD
ncbi:vWA domain-containing protein [Pelagibacterium limicola]|uniref:vWA domain-containing protein n=1 Tax=Pelagibacterium limicola TaxID=2791022 RepID=UPI0018AF8606|nr:VWA domain-containing protein [Pelagibacterium limicola]